MVFVQVVLCLKSQAEARCARYKGQVVWSATMGFILDIFGAHCVTFCLCEDRWVNAVKQESD